MVSYSSFLLWDRPSRGRVTIALAVAPISSSMERFKVGSIVRMNVLYAACDAAMRLCTGGVPDSKSAAALNVSTSGSNNAGAGGGEDEDEGAGKGASEVSLVGLGGSREARQYGHSGC
jgi:hypothetical protein